jgi:hypothetical protein
MRPSSVMLQSVLKITAVNRNHYVEPTVALLALPQLLKQFVTQQNVIMESVVHRIRRVQKLSVLQIST